MDKIEWQVQNEYNIDKFNLKYPKTELQSFMGWKGKGRIVRKGEKQKSFVLPVVSGTTIDPISGEDVARHTSVTVWGFTKDQTDEAS